MARLNESSGDALECLKRRFVRQNKELVLNNSTQSMKIRALEIEVSRLVEENGLLLEENTHLRARIQNQSNTVTIRRDIDLIKQRVESHTQEIVASLEVIAQEKQLAQVTANNNPRDATPLSTNPCPSHNRSAYGLEGSWALPIIWEGKSSHQTLEECFNENTESSDKCVVDETDFQEEVSRVSRRNTNLDNISAITKEVESTRSHENSQQHELLGNRKRRRISTYIADVDTTELTKENGPHLGRCEHESLSLVGSENFPESHDITKSIDARVKSEELEQSTFADHLSGKWSGRDRQERKPLATKPVNTDPKMSSGKRSRSAVAHGEQKRSDSRGLGSIASENSNTGQLKEHKPNAGKKTVSRVHFGQMQDPEIGPELENSIITKAEPLTLAQIDIISPTSERNLELQRQSRDTPPPPNAGEALGSMKLGVGGREKRARTTVNYAEPNLISKMRRPSKGLVDAVMRDERRDSLRPSTSAGVDNEWEYACEGSATTSPSGLDLCRKVNLRATRSPDRTNILSQLEKAPTTSELIGTGLGLLPKLRTANIDLSTAHSSDKESGNRIDKNEGPGQAEDLVGQGAVYDKRERSQTLEIFDCIESPSHLTTRGSSISGNLEKSVLQLRKSASATLSKERPASKNLKPTHGSRRKTVSGRKREHEGVFDDLGELECSKVAQLNTELTDVCTTETKRMSLRRRSGLV